MGEKNRFIRNPDAASSARAALQALSSDAASDDTSRKCIPKRLECSGRIVAKSSFVLCGAAEASKIFKSRRIRSKWNFLEGEKIKKGETVCRVRGNARSLLACERTALNYLSLLSGIATKSRAASEKYGKWKIAATRKTPPGLANSVKRAVLCGGCLTHRLSLSDGILVKDNHIAAIMKWTGARKERAIEIAEGSFPKSAFVEIEVSSASEALAAARAGASAILVDNVSPSVFGKIAKAARKVNRKITVEASGGITLKNAGRYLKAGADFASTSELTMNAAPANLSLEIDF